MLCLFRFRSGQVKNGAGNQTSIKELNELIGAGPKEGRDFDDAIYFKRRRHGTIIPGVAIPVLRSCYVFEWFPASPAKGGYYFS